MGNRHQFLQNPSLVLGYSSMNLCGGLTDQMPGIWQGAAQLSFNIAPERSHHFVQSRSLLRREMFGFCFTSGAEK